MRGLFILANGFEDTEGIAVIDILKRAKIGLDIATIGGSLEINSQSGLSIKAEMFLEDVNLENYDFLVIPGGRAVYEVLDKSSLLSNVILDFSKQNKLIAAICAGPSQVGKLGLYENKTYTCFPTTEASITKGKLDQTKGVVVSENFITAKAMGYSFDFGFAIVEYLLGKEALENVKRSVYGDN